MNRFLGCLALACACAGGFAVTACSADIHDNTANVHGNTVNIDNATVNLSSDADTSNVHPGDSVPCHVDATNVVLVDPDKTPSADQAKGAGYFKFYIDSEDSDPVLVTAQTDVSIKISASITPGDHKIICHLDKHDGTPTSATAEISFHVTASATTG